ncbi:hypothetical protein [Candidatus Neptunochlamydia vexilliferae]|nr:hypothetical protein [Candidatus Neptunochlamydia vexilliferae]
MSVENLSNHRQKIIESSASLDVKQLVCFEVKKRDGDNAFASQVDANERNWTSASELEQIQMFADQYKKRMRNHEIAMVPMHIGREVLNKAFSVGKVGTGKVVVGAAQWGVDKIMGFAIDEMDKRGKASAKNILAEHLQGLSSSKQNAFQNDINQILADSSLSEQQQSERARERLFSSLRENPSKSLTEFDENAQPVAMQYVAESLQKNMQNMGAIFGAQIGDLQHDVGNLEAVTTGLMKTQQKTYRAVQSLQKNIDVFGRKMDHINGRVQRNYEEIKKLQGGVQGNRRAILNNAQQIHIVKDMMFGELSPEKQLEAIRSGAFPEQAHRKEMLEAAVQKREMIRTAQFAMNGASILLQAADTFGAYIPPKTRKMVEVGMQVGNIAIHAMTGNFMGAAQSLFGLIGKKGPDVAAVRHKQIMNQFDQVFKGLNALSEGQQKIMKNQQKMFTALNQLMEGQHKIYKRIELVSQQIEQTEKNILKEISQIKEYIFFGIRLNVYNHFKLIRDAHAVFKGLEVTPQEYDFIEGRFTSYEGLHRFMVTDKNGRKLLNAVDAFESALSHDYKFFAISSENENKVQLDAYLKFDKCVWQPLISFFKKELLTEGPRRDVSPLLIPMKSYKGLKQREDRFRSAEQKAIGSLEHAKHVYNHLYNYLVPETVIEFSELLLKMQKYLPFIKSGGRLFTFEELLSSRPGARATIILKQLQKLIEVTIAQQTLLGGDRVLPYIIPILAEGPGHHKFKEARDLVTAQIKGGNHPFFDNFIVEYIREKTSSLPLRYGNALKGDREDIFKRVLGSHCGYRRINKQWFISFSPDKGNSSYAPLPTYHQVNRPLYQQRELLGKLMELRSSIGQALMEHESEKTTAYKKILTQVMTRQVADFSYKHPESSGINKPGSSNNHAARSIDSASPIDKLIQQSKDYLFRFRNQADKELYVSSADSIPYAEKRDAYTNTSAFRREFKLIPVRNQKGYFEIDLLNGKNLYISSADSTLYAETRRTHTNTESERRRFKATYAGSGYFTFSLQDRRELHISSKEGNKLKAAKRGQETNKVSSLRNFRLERTPLMDRASQINAMIKKYQKRYWTLELPTERELYVSSADRIPYAEKRDTHTNKARDRRSFKINPASGKEGYFELRLHDGRELYITSAASHCLFAEERDAYTNTSPNRRRFKITPAQSGCVNLSLGDKREVYVSSADGKLYAEKRGTHTNKESNRRDFKLVLQ